MGKKTKQEELEEIKRQRALSDWNQGRDESLRELSKAESLFSSRGYSAAKAGKDKDKVRALAESVINAEPNEKLPETAKTMFLKKQQKVAELYDDFMRDADEFSGKPVGNYEPLKPRWKQQEEEAEKRKAEAKKAADEKFDEVKNTPGAQVFDWRDVDGAPGSRREVRGLGDNKDEELVQIETPSGGFITARGKGLTDNLSKAEVRAREEMARAQKFQETLANNRRERAMNRLTDSGYDWKSEDSAALFNPDGTLNTAKAKRAADLAQGQKVRATFDAWDYDKQLDRDAQAIARDSRSKLRILRGAAREGRATDKDLAEMRELERTVSLGDKPRNRDGLRAGFWRTEAEDQDRNRRAEVEKFRVLAESQQKQADAVRTRTESLGRPLSDEEIKSAGYPAWDDEVAWQELIKVNPAAAEIYKMRPVNVSKAGRAMSKALSVFA